ncbi:MAG: type II toxin-antitoxin system TacA family antitoxin [Limisphaerales bacterium]
MNLRVTPQLKRLLVKAAEMQDLQLTDFMLNAARTAAEVAIADRTQFVLPPGKWRAFNAALDEPPREIPTLRELFSEKSLFQDRE